LLKKTAVNPLSKKEKILKKGFCLKEKKTFPPTKITVNPLRNFLLLKKTNVFFGGG
jgi:hypothetical protein